MSVVKRKMLSLMVLLVFLVSVIAVKTNKVEASTVQASVNYVYPGSVRCGSLSGWGYWRNTADIRYPRTIYFEPARTGMHSIQFYTYGQWPSGSMTPSWSNDSGRTWNTWQWSPGYFNWNTGTITLNLRTDTTRTIYKFVFSGQQNTYIAYRFYCK